MTADKTHPLTTRQPNDVIAHDGDGPVRVDQFIARAAALAKELPQRNYVINVADDRYRFLLGFCAAVIAGQCTLMPPNRQQQTLQQLAQDYPDCYSFGYAGIDTIECFNAPPSLPSSAAPSVPRIPDDRLCAIAFTSGSTGKSMPNRKYWRTIRISAESNLSLLPDADDAVMSLLATVPPQHMWGFETSVTLPLFYNVAVSHLSPLFPQDIVDALSTLRQPRVLVSSPVHLDALLQADAGKIALDYIFSATAPLSGELARQLEDYFGTRVIEMFGCSESGAFAVRRTAEESLWRRSSYFTLHTREDGVWVQARHLPEDILLQDVIELVDDDHFRWLGRNQDMVNIAGRRGSLADLNRRLNAIPGVVDGVVFMPSDDARRLAALVVAPGLKPADILRQLKRGLDPALLPRPVYNVDTLPRQDTGKLPRKELRELFERLQDGRSTTSNRLADRTG